MRLAYAEFAALLSVVDVALYLVLLTIAFRRAAFRDRRAIARTETIAIHARFVEGPVITVLALIAIATAILAVNIGQADYAKFAGWFVAAVRGGLFFFGLWLAGWYWKVRATWR